jgi:uncharacterized protein
MRYHVRPAMAELSLEQLRRYTVARTLFAPTTLPRALAKLGYVQADPIRAPARAQDLMLRHRVKNYRAGDLERLYPKLSLEEDFFVNYGFVTHALHALMHPRKGGKRRPWDAGARRRAAQILRFVQEHGAVHPRDVEAHFDLGQVTNYWGGTSSATTHLLEKMHYRGLLRVVRRDSGVRVYAVQPEQAAVRSASERSARIDKLVDTLVDLHAPLPKPSLGPLLNRLRYAVPQWEPQLKAAISRAKERLSSAKISGVEWYWPGDEQLEKTSRYAAAPELALLSPFDPLVWDRRRFQLLWGWSYRFEAYTPMAKRLRGYYALPLLWRDDIIGWANLSLREGVLHSELGFLGKRPKEPAFERELEAELARIRAFLALPGDEV